LIEQEPMFRIRVYDLAKEMNTSSKRIVEKLRDAGITKKNHMSIITPEELKTFLNHTGYNKKVEHKLNTESEQDNIQKQISIRPQIVNFNTIRESIREKAIRVTDIESNVIYIYPEEKIDDRISKKVQMIYNAIEYTKKGYGDFKKCEFHIHTPASHDFTLHSSYRKTENEDNGEFHELKTTSIIDIIEMNNIYSRKDIEKIRESIDYYSGKEYSRYLKDNDIPFKNFNEEAAYILIAHCLYVNEIHMAVIADHNTIDGYKKLKFAIKEYYNRQEGISKHFVNLFLGVEISCSEKNHVVGIFDDNNFDSIRLLIEDIIENPKEGSYYPSLYVLNKIFEIGGVGYLAHINSLDLSGNMPYNRKLFNITEMKIIGLTVKGAKQKQLDRIAKYTNVDIRDYCFIYESDAHVIDDIGKKNSWVKFNEVNFKALKKAIEDHGICIKMNEPSKSDKFIKGVVVTPGDTGFLKINKVNKKKYAGEEFFIEFSQDLNCIIGGRGTGKSTLLNIIDLCFRQQIEDLNLLNFISKNKEIVIVFCCNGIDYVLRLIPQVEYINDDGTVKYLEDAFTTPFYEKKDYFKLSSNWYEFYQVKKENGELYFNKINGFSIINDFYRRGYSINDLVGKIKGRTISSFIRNIVLYGLQYRDMSKEFSNLKYSDGYSIEKYLTKNLKKIIKIIKEQNDIVTEALSGFNNTFSNQIQVSYKSFQSDNEEIVDILAQSMSNQDGKKFVAKTYLQWNEVLVYLKVAISKIGYLEFLNLLLNRKYATIEKQISISEFSNTDKITMWMAEMKLSSVCETNISLIYSEIRNKLVNTSDFLKNSVLYWIRSNDEFTLRFNVNNKETIRKQEILFKDLHELSMGQKVSAILSFVFNYGKYTKDNTPLIIDQPEDNLDNQYIYKNLIKSLRDIKNERQVIIVTHCSAIVTNADAEHVIVLDSDGKNGWVNACGYATTPKITDHIINYMEGGPESLKNKIRKYSIYNDTLKL